jgi:hypothetical protein
MRKLALILGLSAAAMLASASSSRAAIATAVIHMGVDDTGAFGIDNAVNYLSGDARFSSVASIDVDTTGVPTLGGLSSYASVLVVTDNRDGTLTGGGLGTQLGDVLDDYVAAGGRVVFSAFTGNFFIGVDGDILAVAPWASVGFNAASGPMDLTSASDSVFDGVSSFDSTFASDLSGSAGVITNADHSIMFVNAFPGTQSDYSNGSNFGLLFANALAYEGEVVPEPSSVVLAGLGGLGLMGLVRRRRRTARV